MEESLFTPKANLLTPNTTPGFTPKRRIVQDFCPYCLEPLANIVENELIIELICNHSIHLNCLLLLTNQIGVKDDEIQCPDCHLTTKPIMDISKYKHNLEELQCLALPTVIVPPDDGEPITPQEQVGPQFWEKEVNPHLESSKPKVLDLGGDEIDLAKVIIAPQYSSIERDQLKEDVYCAVQVSTTKFETVELGDEMKNDIMKANIIGDLIRNWNFTVDVSDLNRGLIFDYFDEVSIGGKKYTWCQVFLFETAILLIHNEELTLNQKLDVDDTFISSVFNQEENIIVNLNSFKVPEIKMKSNNKILRYKWMNIFKKYLNKSQQFQIYNDIPLIQLSTNAWPLVTPKYLPPDIEIINKLLTKGLDLPSGFLQRQLIKPDPKPVKLILVIPLFNPEEGQWTNEEYSRLTQQLLNSVLESMNAMDQLGVVFLQNERPDLLGSYYGCGTNQWDGWQLIIESLTEEVITSKSRGDQWLKGLEILQLLSNLSFHEDKYINEVVFITNELISGVEINSMTSSSPFNIERVNNKMSIALFIKKLTDDFNLQFNTILLTDEYTFEMIDIWTHFQELKFVCNNMRIVLDYEDVRSALDDLIEDFHEIVIDTIKVDIKPQTGVDVIFSELDHIGGFQLKNLRAGYQGSHLMKLKIDKERYTGELVDAHVEVDGEIKFNTRAQMKIVSQQVNFDELELVGGKSKMNIVPQLSNTPNGVFLRRQIERLIMDEIFELIINVDRFDIEAKQRAKEGLRLLCDNIWELFNGCNGGGVNLEVMEKWVNQLIDDIEMLNEGFNLRNIDLAKMKGLIMYLKFI